MNILGDLDNCNILSDSETNTFSSFYIISSLEFYFLYTNVSPFSQKEILSPLFPKVIHYFGLFAKLLTIQETPTFF